MGDWVLHGVKEIVSKEAIKRLVKLWINTW